MAWIRAIYRVRSTVREIETVALMLALEQSVEVPATVVTDPFVAEHIMGKVASITPLDDSTFRVEVLLATQTTGFETAQTLNMLFGNSSLHEHIELTSVEFPPDYLAHCPGPRSGIAKIRDLVHAHDRPLTCAALKPQGLSTEKLAELAYTFAAGGIDVIKDDHGLASQSYSPFVERVNACQQAINRANRVTGHHAVYAPSLVGSPSSLIDQARIVHETGTQMVMICPSLVGPALFEELVRTTLKVPVLAHPAFGGAARISPPLLIGALYRLWGADGVIFPNFGGRFSYSAQTCHEIADHARKTLGSMPRAFPVPAGGLSVDRVPELVSFYGQDVMLLIGGSLLAAGNALPDRVKEFVQAAAQAASSN